MAACFGLALLTPVLEAKKLELTKKAGDLTVEITIARDPPTLGKNALEIRLRDGAGQLIPEAKVMVNYYMPPMPRMAPMNYRVEAKRKSEAFKVDMNIIMAGPWIVIIRITIEEKTSTVKFQFDAR